MVSPQLNFFPGDTVGRSKILSLFPGAHTGGIWDVVAKLTAGAPSLRALSALCQWSDFFAVRLPETRSVSESGDSGRSDRSGNRDLLPRER